MKFKISDLEVKSKHKEGFKNLMFLCLWLCFRKLVKTNFFVKTTLMTIYVIDKIAGKVLSYIFLFVKLHISQVEWYQDGCLLIFLFLLKKEKEDQIWTSSWNLFKLF